MSLHSRRPQFPFLEWPLEGGRISGSLNLELFTPPSGSPALPRLSFLPSHARATVALTLESSGWLCTPVRGCPPGFPTGCSPPGPTMLGLGPPAAGGSYLGALVSKAAPTGSARLRAQPGTLWHPLRGRHSRGQCAHSLGLPAAWPSLVPLLLSAGRRPGLTHLSTVPLCLGVGGPPASPDSGPLHPCELTPEHLQTQAVAASGPVSGQGPSPGRLARGSGRPLGTLPRAALTVLCLLRGPLHGPAMRVSRARDTVSGGRTVWRL